MNLHQQHLEAKRLAKVHAVANLFCCKHAAMESRRMEVIEHKSDIQRLEPHEVSI